MAVERLGDLLISEASFLAGVSDEVLEIQRQLKEMQKFLKDADHKRGNQEVGRWVAEIRELALQIEDVLETYAVNVASRTEGGGIKKFVRRFACSLGECIELHKIGSEIGTIQEKITNLATSRQTFGIQALHDHQVEDSKAEEERRRQLRITYAHSIEKDFVGMEDETKELILRLKDNDKGYQVVSVWGMGGQGKTTLARELYNHPDVRSHFQAFAWVCITQKLERQKVLQDMLQGLLPARSKEEIRGMGDAELVELLYKTQKELMCLVVIDDIWSVADWEVLKPAFPIEEKTGSKILLTTRNEAVANIGYSYKLRSLTNEEGWKLLSKKIFPNRNEDAGEFIPHLFVSFLTFAS